jgi:hypothetical protein
MLAKEGLSTTSEGTTGGVTGTTKSNPNVSATTLATISGGVESGAGTTGSDGTGVSNTAASMLSATCDGLGVSAIVFSFTLMFIVFGILETMRVF